MPAEIIAIIDKPWLLAILLAIGAACGITVERLVENVRRAERRAYWQARNANKGKDKVARAQPIRSESRAGTAAEQLRVVMEANSTRDRY
jgi:hypothetical protein